MFKRLIIILTALLMIVFALNAVAFANVIPDQLRISLWPEYYDNQVMFMAGVKYPDNTPLPIDVKLAIPKGAKVIWAGEIMGDISQDIQTTPTVNSKVGYDEVAFTLTKSRAGQVETSWAGLNVNGQNRSISLDWTQRYDAKETVFIFREPSQAFDVKLSLPENLSNQQQLSQGFHETNPIKLSVGQKQIFNVTYKRSTDVPTVNDQSVQRPQTQVQPSAQAPSSSNPIDTATIVVVIVGALIIGALVFLKIRLK
ncbi:MAG: hypothetical protein QME63_06210 [Actinomycetota bacterium]|nr:hypothetical protein [Actinomycetota bacterium]